MGIKTTWADAGVKEDTRPAEQASGPKVARDRIAGDDPRIERAAAGDRAAASSLLSELLPRIRNLVRFMVRGDSEVDDMAQNAMLEVLRAMPSFRGDSAFTTWADRITVRCVMRHISRRKREREKRQRAEPELRLLRTSVPPEGRGEGYNARRRLALVLETLPPAQREALVLHHVVGLSVPEVAREVGVSFDTTKSRIRLGMERLRNYYLRNHDE